MPWFMSTQTGVIWEQGTLTKKMHPPQWSMGKPMVHFFFFLLSCILIFCLWGWGCWDRVSLQTLISICLCFQSAWIKGTHHHAQLTHLFEWWCERAQLTMGGVIPGNAGPQCNKKADWDNHGEQDNKQYSSLNSASRFLLPWLPWMMRAGRWSKPFHSNVNYNYDTKNTRFLIFF